MSESVLIHVAAVEGASRLCAHTSMQPSSRMSARSAQGIADTQYLFAALTMGADVLSALFGAAVGAGGRAGPFDARASPVDLCTLLAELVAWAGGPALIPPTDRHSETVTAAASANNTSVVSSRHRADFFEGPQSDHRRRVFDLLLYPVLSTHIVRPLDAVRRSLQEVRPGLFISGKQAAAQPLVCRWADIRGILRCYASHEGPAAALPEDAVLQREALRTGGQWLVTAAIPEAYRPHCRLDADGRPRLVTPGSALTMDRLEYPVSAGAYAALRGVVPAVDDDTFDISIYFQPQVFRFIHAMRAVGGGVLVHCSAGRHRSAAICAAYLIWADLLGASEAGREGTTAAADSLSPAVRDLLGDRGAGGSDLLPSSSPTPSPPPAPLGGVASSLGTSLRPTATALADRAFAEVRRARPMSEATAATHAAVARYATFALQQAGSA